MRIVKSIIAFWENYDILAQPSISKKKVYKQNHKKCGYLTTIYIYTILRYHIELYQKNYSSNFYDSPP